MEDPIGRWTLPALTALLLMGTVFMYEALKCCRQDSLRHNAGRSLTRLLNKASAARSALRTLRLYFYVCLGFLTARCFPRLNAWQQPLAALIVTLIIHFICTLLPARAARRHADGVVRAFAPLYNTLSLLLRPITALNERIQQAMPSLKMDDEGAMNEHVTEDEIRAMMDLGEEKGELEGDEHELLENVFDFGDLNAADCMVHRVDMTAIWIGDDEKTVCDLIAESGRSRFPVYDENTDDIVGILFARDFLLNMNKKPGEKKPLRKLLREPYFVPETVKAGVLLKNMQLTKNHMAMVVDEYGGISGLVTMEDLLEQIVGEIYDEYDKPETVPEIQKIADDTWRADGSVELEALGEAMGVTIPESEDYDTLGGLFLSRFAEIPEDGTQPETVIPLTKDLEEPESGPYDALRIRVEKLLDHRVEQATVQLLRMENTPPPEAEEKA